MKLPTPGTFSTALGKCASICALACICYAATWIPSCIEDWKRTRVSENVVVFESDDWYPRSNVIASRVWTDTDCAYDLQELSRVLRKHRDLLGRPAVFTLNCILTEPNFKQIAANGFTEYAWTPIDQVAPDTIAAIKKGMSEGLYWPQAHGREHFHAERWLDSIRGRDKDALSAFSRGRVALHIDLSGIRNADDQFAERWSYEQRCDFLFRATTSPLIAPPGEELKERDLRYARKWVQDTQEIFTRVFGFPSKSWIAPSYCWTAEIEAELSHAGVHYIQGADSWTPAVSRLGEPVRSRKRFGSRSTLNQIFLERNVLFEPATDMKSTTADYIRKIRTAWGHHLPAVITGHANGFQGELQRPLGLHRLDELLEKLEDTDALFINSEQLGDLVELGTLTLAGPRGRRTISTQLPFFRRLLTVMLESKRASVSVFAAIACFGVSIIAWLCRGGMKHKVALSNTSTEAETRRVGQIF